MLCLLDFAFRYHTNIHSFWYILPDELESLNGWIKNELYKDFKIYLADDINVAIKDYINYFNTRRLAYSLKYKTPIQYRTEQGFI